MLSLTRLASKKKRSQEPAQKFFINYDPNDAQIQMAEAIKNGAKVILFVGGIRSGKTVGGVAECLKQIYQYKKKPRLGYIVSPTYPMSWIPDRIFKTLSQTNAGSLIAHEAKGDRYYEMRPTADDPDHFFRVEIKSADNPDSLRGSSLAFILLDEAAMMSPDTFTICQGRVLDSDGIIIITTTPRGKNWVYDKVYRKSLDDPRYVVIKAKTSDNKYLNPELVKELYGDYKEQSGRLVAQELNAEFISFEGQVFTNFDPSKHVIREQSIPDSAKIVCGVDWGFNDPFVCVWLAKHDGCWIVLDEYYKSRTPLGDHAAYIKNHWLYSRIDRIWVDPSRIAERQEFERIHGIKKCFKARRPDQATKLKWPVDRARLINRLMGMSLHSPFDEKKNIPGLVYFDTVRHGVQETMNLAYKLVGEETKDGIRVTDLEGKEVQKNATEELVDFNNHFIDALGYALYSEVRTYSGAKPHYFDPALGKVVELETPPTPKERLRAELDAWNRHLDEKKKLIQPTPPESFDTLGNK